MPTSDETTITFSDDIAVAQHQAEEADAVRQAEIEADRIRREEEATRKRRYTVQNEILGHLRLVSALLDELIVPDVPEEEQRVITSMLRRQYLAAVDLVPEFREAGGEQYAVDRGPLRHYFGE